MGKLVFKVVALLVITIGISHYGMYLMTGQSPLSGMSFSTPELPKLSAPSLPKATDTAYKWTDENGVTHYSSEAPEHVQAKTIAVDPNTNIVQATKLREKTETKPNTAPQPSVTPPGPLYDPQTVKKLMDDAKNVQNTLNERYESLEKY
jgi:hypothetical protein